MGFDRAGSIRFQLFREQWVISYIEFSLLLGLYDMDYTSTLQYKELLIDFLSGVTAKGMWQHLSRGWSYELGLTKGSFLTCLTLRYFHAIMACSFINRAKSTGVVG